MSLGGVPASHFPCVSTKRSRSMFSLLRYFWEACPLQEAFLLQFLTAESFPGGVPAAFSRLRWEAFLLHLLVSEVFLRGVPASFSHFEGVSGSRPHFIFACSSCFQETFQLHFPIAHAYPGRVPALFSHLRDVPRRRPRGIFAFPVCNF